MITITELYQRDKGICALCRRKIENISSASRDHIIPSTYGGTSHRSNLQLAHKTCNSQKNHRILLYDHSFRFYPEGKKIYNDKMTSMEARIIQFVSMNIEFMKVY